MKALFYGGAISSLAGLALGMGMALPPQAAPSGADIQPVDQLVATGMTESASYGDPVQSYPASYVVDTAYSSGPVYDLRPEVEAQPVADVTYEEPAIDRVLKNAWTDEVQPAAAPQEVAAAGDTRPAPDPSPPARTRTYASIDAVLAATKDAAPGAS